VQVDRQCERWRAMQAYDTLMNPKARTAYNAQLEVALKDEEDGFTGVLLPMVLHNTILLITSVSCCLVHPHHCVKVVSIMSSARHVYRGRP
jgi:hypothetical protein